MPSAPKRSRSFSYYIFAKVHIFCKITIFSQSKFQTKLTILTKSFLFFKSVELIIFEILPPRFILNFTSMKVKSQFHPYVFRIHIYPCKIYLEVHPSISKFTELHPFQIYPKEFASRKFQSKTKYHPTKISSHF